MRYHVLHSSISYESSCSGTDGSRSEEAEKIYGLLTEKGEIFMKMEETGFATRFAMFRDQFGVSWMILCQG